MTVKISDIITPDVWRDYGANRVRELSALWASGLVSSIPGIEVPNGGATINIPHFNDLTGDAENLSDSSPLTPAGLNAGQQIAPVIGRGKAWAANDLAGVFAGKDPAKAIMDRIAAFWARQMQKELIQIATGVFGAATMSGLVHDISAETGSAAVIGGETFVDATQKLGDAKGSVSNIAMHSAVEAKLAKDKLIVYETLDDKSDRVPFYMGKQVIVDDNMPVSTGVYTTYIFGQGVAGYSERAIGPSDIETDRDILAGDSVIAMRRRFLLHLMGTKWVGTPAGAFPSRAELAVGGNWERVYELKSIPMIAFKHKIA